MEYQHVDSSWEGCHQLHLYDFSWLYVILFDLSWHFDSHFQHLFLDYCYFCEWSWIFQGDWVLNIFSWRYFYLRLFCRKICQQNYCINFFLLFPSLISIYFALFWSELSYIYFILPFIDIILHFQSFLGLLLSFLWSIN